MTDQITQEVWETVQKINRLWTVDGHPESLRRYFHPKMVAITPTEQLRVEGGDACVRSWTAFTEQNKTLKWEEKEPRINLYADNTVAVVTYYFDMVFENHGHKITMRGRDMLTLAKENGCWLVVADQFSPTP